MPKLIIGLLIIMTSYTTMAWNKHIHSLIGEIAYLEMTPIAQSKVNQYLQKMYEEYPDYEWQKNGNTLMGGFSYWADWFRAKKSYSFHDYHYMSTPIYIGQPQHIDIPTDANELDGVMIHEMLRIEDIIANAATESITPFFLAKYIHMIGDIHQPLHAADRYHEQYFPNGDRGGNDLIIRKPSPQNEKTNLHRYWDRALDLYTQSTIDLDQLALDAKTLSQQCNHPLVNELNPIQWWYESAQIFLHDAYVDSHKGKAQEILPEHHLSSDYQEKNQLIAEQRIILAGCRLGKKLNALLDQ